MDKLFSPGRQMKFPEVVPNSVIKSNNISCSIIHLHVAVNIACVSPATPSLTHTHTHRHTHAHAHIYLSCDTLILNTFALVIYPIPSSFFSLVYLLRIFLGIGKIPAL